MEKPKENKTDIYSKYNNKYKQDETIQILDFLIDNIFVLYGGPVFEQTIGIPMGTNCAPLLAISSILNFKLIWIDAR
jgi:hypothetical protein